MKKISKEILDKYKVNKEIIFKKIGPTLEKILGNVNLSNLELYTEVDFFILRNYLINIITKKKEMCDFKLYKYFINNLCQEETDITFEIFKCDEFSEERERFYTFINNNVEIDYTDNDLLNGFIKLDGLDDKNKSKCIFKRCKILERGFSYLKPHIYDECSKYGIVKENIDAYENMYEFYKKLRDDFNKLKDSFENEFLFLDYSFDIFLKELDRYKLLYYKAILKLLPDANKPFINEIILAIQNNGSYIDNIYLGDSLEVSGLINYFSSEADKLIEENNPFNKYEVVECLVQRDYCKEALDGNIIDSKTADKILKLRGCYLDKCYEKVASLTGNFKEMKSIFQNNFKKNISYNDFQNSKVYIDEKNNKLMCILPYLNPENKIDFHICYIISLALTHNLIMLGSENVNAFGLMYYTDSMLDANNLENLNDIILYLFALNIFHGYDGVKKYIVNEEYLKLDNFAYLLNDFYITYKDVLNDILINSDFNLLIELFGEDNIFALENSLKEYINIVEKSTVFNDLQKELKAFEKQINCIITLMNEHYQNSNYVYERK